MAHAITHTYHDGGLNGWIEALRRRYADYRLFRRTVEELDALNDRELSDLGLSRLNVRDVAWDSVYGK